MNRLLENDQKLSSNTLHGRAWCEAYSAKVDEWLAMLWNDVAGERTDVALVATGGHGRRELCPESDLDLLLLYKDKGSKVDELAKSLWYPMWDIGVKLGHAVRTVDEALSLARDDLDVATSLLSARCIAGSADLAQELNTRAHKQWRTESRRALDELRERVEERQAKAGEVAFLLEPDLKEGRGGLRDVHSLWWAEAALPVLGTSEQTCLAEDYETLLATRVELHRSTGRRGERLSLQDQDAVGTALGLADGDELMARVASAARSIAWTSDIVWHRYEQSRRRSRPFRDRPRTVAPCVILDERTIYIDDDCAVNADPVLPLRVAAAAALHRAYISRDSLERMARETPHMPAQWPDDARFLLTDLLLVGHAAIPVIEALDQLGLWHRMIPEWEPCRSKPQRNAYHRFTVDRHLCEAAAQAAALVDRVDRPDLLVLGALFHDIGKGYVGDHTEVGIQLVDRIGGRMGYSDDEVTVLTSMVRHHLLLPDIATRRDLDDEGTIRSVAVQVGNVETLELLAALTEADSIATGPAAWGAWKADLVNELVRRTAHSLRGGDVHEMKDAPFPTDEHRVLLARRELIIDGVGDTVTVIAPDRPGLFSRVAGALALNGVDVVHASGHSEDGMAIEVLRVVSMFDNELNWPKVSSDIERAVDGKIALRARLAERARTYRSRPATAARPVEPKVVIDNHSSDVATVVEVVAPDGVGVLYRITTALLESDLDIVSAKIETLGSQVIDAFYVRDRKGAKVVDDQYLVEIERAILYALTVDL
jgi:[protein-PII] uridylyltransferase